MRSLIVFCAASILAPPLTAQVHPGVTIRVRAPSVLLGRFEGTYLGRSADTLLLGNEERGAFRVPVSAVTQFEVSRGRSRARGAGQGALWGGVVGVALGLLFVSTATTDDAIIPFNKGMWVAQSAAGGAELGAIIGFFVGKRVWTGAEPTWLMSAPRVSPHRLGVQLAVRYTR
jgi:hypothetical protein